MTHLRTTQSYLLPDLAEILRREIKLLKLIKQRVEEETDFLVSANISRLASTNSIIESLILRERKLEGHRQDLVAQIGASAGFPPGARIRLRELVPRLESNPEVEEIQRLADEIRETTDEIARLNERNNALIQFSLDFNNGLVRLLAAASNQKSFYDSAGTPVEERDQVLDCRF